MLSIAVCSRCPAFIRASRLMFAVFLALSLHAALVVRAAPQQPANPIIGIFTKPLNDSGLPPPGVVANAAVDKLYVDWLQSAGIRVIPFPWNASQERMRYLAKRVNGVLFPGGGLVGEPLDAYIHKAREVLDLALEWNANGDPFFVWGTCQGFQVLCAAAARNVSVIQGYYHGMYPRMLALNFTRHQPTSTLFGTHTTPSTVLAILKSKPSTVNWHHMCVTPQSFHDNPHLAQVFQPLSTNVDPVGGAEFVSSVEVPHANIFATQFHPERPPYDFTNDRLSHSADVVAVSRYLADFVAARAKLNNHSFDTPQDAEAMNVERFPLQNFGWGYEFYWVQDQNE